uniref:Secreted protein n=1 Tax=Rhipicephalus microplus TaxID=6941 RepID=A0A6G5A2D0_RHIMP
MFWSSLHIHLCETVSALLYAAGLCLCCLSLHSCNEMIRVHHCTVSRSVVGDTCSRTWRQLSNCPLIRVSSLFFTLCFMQLALNIP